MDSGLELDALESGKRRRRVRKWGERKEAAVHAEDEAEKLLADGERVREREEADTNGEKQAEGEAAAEERKKDGTEAKEATESVKKVFLEKRG